MDAIQISRNAKIYSIDSLDAIQILEESDGMFIVLAKDINYRLSVGERLVFRRYIYGTNENVDVLTETVYITEKTRRDGHDAIRTTLPQGEILRPLAPYNCDINIKATEVDCVDNYDAYFDYVHRYLMVKSGDSYIPNDWLYYYNTGDTEYFILEFASNHNIFAQDIDFADTMLSRGFSLDVLTNQGVKIGTLGGLSVVFTGMPYFVTSADTLTETTIDACGYEYDISEFKYTHTPSSFSRRRIAFTTAETNQADGTFFDKVAYLIKNGFYFRPSYNPYYFYEMDGSYKKCTLWYDKWWETYSEKNNIRPLKEIYVNSGDTRAAFGIENDYWNIPTITFSSDEFRLGVEEAQSNAYVDNIIETAIPDIIDMERFKYSPVIMRVNEYELAKSITLDLHFRRRDVVDNVESKVAQNGSYPIYSKGWFINEESGNTIWWNGMGTTDSEGKYTDAEGHAFDQSLFNDFYDNSGKTSDLLGYLGFTDDDVFYRKSKLSKSFVRLSFYTSTDPVSQKLLYYSTSFLDATTLFGKYMKQSMLKYEKYGEFENTPIVFYDDNSVSARVDCEINIENEFNNLASSEGFNLYLFADDADKTDKGKDYRTIYMKVEFNHAGNGKTIPMVMWPKDDDAFRKITIDSFLHDLYIPVRVRYIDGKFVYYFPTAKNENGKIRLILFEPKLDYYD